MLFGDIKVRACAFHVARRQCRHCAQADVLDSIAHSRPLHAHKVHRQDHKTAMHNRAGYN